ncbi:hypothetical protein ACTXT7_001961 [Hymenolepis weldensis]
MEKRRVKNGRKNKKTRRLRWMYKNWHTHTNLAEPSQSQKKAKIECRYAAANVWAQVECSIFCIVIKRNVYMKLDDIFAKLGLQ